jgi:long-chain acyl-CoA synthetase
MGELDLRDFFYNNLKNRRSYFFYQDRYRTWKWTFDKVLSLSLKFSSYLESNGLKKGDRVILKAGSNPEWIIVFLGCIMSGKPVVPIDTRSDQKFLNMVVYDVEPSMVIISKDYPEDEKVVTERSGSGYSYIEDIEEKIVSLEEFDYTEVSIKKEDIVEIVYTSGTTSAPKGVTLTFENIQSNLRMALPVISKWKKFLKIIPGSRLLSVVPLSHMYGQVAGLFIPVSIDLSVFFPLNKTPQDILRSIKHNKIIALAALPQQLKVLKDHIIDVYGLHLERFRKIYEKYKKKRWWIRYIRFLPFHIKIGLNFLGIISGGAHIKEEVDEFYRTMAFGFFQGYGLTETAPLLAVFDPSRNKAGSVGSFLDSENVKIENGELYVRGSSVTPGYYKDEEKTRHYFREGWFKTGDAVEVDEEGNVFIKGRKDDMIVKESGVNIYPSDIAKKFRKQEEVKDCAIFGMESDGRKQIIAVLLLKNRNISKKRVDEIVDTVNLELNVDQRVDDYLIWEGRDFPRTSTMNIKKREILEKLQESTKDKKIRPAEKEGGEKDIFSIVQKIKKTRGKKGGEASLEKDLGMDSLDIMSFSSELEKHFDIDVSLLDITSDTKIKDIEERIKNPPKKTKRLPFFNFAYNPLFTFLRTVFQYLIFPFVRMTYRTRIKGKENLKGIDMPTAFISNHVSFIDSLVILYSLPLNIRKKISVVMSIGHHFNYYFGKKGNIIRRIIEAIGFYLLIILFVNVIPLSRIFGFDQVFKNIGTAVDRGWNILIFPEGGITTDGSVRKFEPGIGIISSDMKIPVIPVRIDGLYNILRSGLLPWGHLPKLPLVKVNIGGQEYYRIGEYEEIAERLYEKVKKL